MLEELLGPLDASCTEAAVQGSSTPGSSGQQTARSGGSPDQDKSIVLVSTVPFEIVSRSRKRPDPSLDNMSSTCCTFCAVLHSVCGVYHIVWTVGLHQSKTGACPYHTPHRASVESDCAPQAARPKMEMELPYRLYRLTKADGSACERIDKHPFAMSRWGPTQRGWIRRHLDASLALRTCTDVVHAACLAAEQSPLGAAPRQRCVPEWRSRHAPSQPCRVYYDGKEKPEEVWAELADGSCRWRQTGSEIKVICLKVHYPSVLPSYAQEAPPVLDTGAVCLYHKVLRCYDVHKFSVQAGYWCCGSTMSTKSGWSHVDGVRAVSRAFQVSCPSLGVRQHSHSPLSFYRQHAGA